MPLNANGNITGTALGDLLWGRALVLGDGSYDNYGDYGNPGALRGFGGNDTIYGDIYYDGDDGLEGDEIYGGDGNDLIYGDTGPQAPAWAVSNLGSSDRLWGDAGDDTMFGQAGNDQLDGGIGNDYLVGGWGSDIIRGGLGNDRIFTDQNSTVILHATGWYNSVFGGDGNDTVIGGRGVDEVYGDNGNDLVYGLAGNDDLEGGNGRDTLRGGDGDDRLDGGGYYATADTDDLLIGEAGNDTIIGGAGNDTIYAGVGNDALDGGIGNDLFDGGLGADSYACGAGNDVYVIDQAGDSFRWEYADSGVDTVRSLIDWTLGTYHENLVLAGTVAVTGRGNALSNHITGSGLANRLEGLGGNDTILGGDRGDVLLGGLGNDRLHGDGGADVLTGGAGADRLRGGGDIDWFVFNALTDSSYGPAGRDVIEDFSAAQADRIDLRGIDANATLAGNQWFTFIGTAGFTGQAGQLHVEVIGASRLISGDVNGDRVADFGILLDDPVALTASCFYL